MKELSALDVVSLLVSFVLVTEVSSLLVFLLRLIKPSLVSTGDDKAG